MDITIWRIYLQNGSLFLVQIRNWIQHNILQRRKIYTYALCMISSDCHGQIYFPKLIMKTCIFTPIWLWLCYHRSIRWILVNWTLLSFGGLGGRVLTLKKTPSQSRRRVWWCDARRLTAALRYHSWSRGLSRCPGFCRVCHAISRNKRLSPSVGRFTHLGLILLPCSIHRSAPLPLEGGGMS